MYIIKSYFKCTFMWEVILPFSFFLLLKMSCFKYDQEGSNPIKPTVLKDTCRFDHLIMFNE